MSGKKEVYRGITNLVLDNSSVTLDTSSHQFGFDNFLSRVSVKDVCPNGTGEFNIVPDYNARTLSLTNVSARVYVPYGRRTNVRAINNSSVRGRFFSGRLSDDDTSSIYLDVPYSFPRRLGPVGSAVAGVAGDLSYIAVTAFPLATVMSPLVRAFEGNPMNYIDETLLLSSGINVGFRGGNLRTFFTCLAVAGVSILGPEVKETIRGGIETGINSLGWEDFLKWTAFFSAWALGKLGRDYYVDKTSRY